MPLPGASDIFTHFAPLSGLVQVVDKGSESYIVLSEVDDVYWKIYVGLCTEDSRFIEDSQVVQDSQSDSEGSGAKWWWGRWTEVEAHQKVVRLFFPCRFSSSDLRKLCALCRGKNLLP